MTNQTQTPAAELKDGVYRWTFAPQGYRLAQPMQATVEGGRVTQWAYYCEDDGSTYPAANAEALNARQADLYAALAQEVNAPHRLSGLCRPVEFTPAPTPEPAAPETLTLAPATIGKARAHLLHKIMGALGVPHNVHYGMAAYAIDEPTPLATLSDLTEAEACRVWAHICRLYSSAPEVAARLKTATRAA